MQTFVCLVSVIKENYGIDRSIVLALSGLAGLGGLRGRLKISIIH
jgi:hypothetical protein